ncbi:hypothetical protein SAMN04488107_3360 [Geodermatophilus saharensis]|uniref:Glycosyl hydrolase catalytic core n=1 Tax=Geodermatophilus saharensis TaxID=1137994 RepID=A0A239GFX9_9ACTN|nr:hypothetical protein SAMN04488107_3360 [Geodermatophilus saharensis]
MRRRPLVITAAAILAASAATGALIATQDRPAPSAQTRPAPSAQTEPDPGGQPRLRAVDGGQEYYARFEPSLPSDPDFFPIGVYFESVLEPGDAELDKAAGLNLYVELTSNSRPEVIHAAGMHAIHSQVSIAGPETVGWLLSDETDMWAGAGDADWSGNHPGEGEVCLPQGARCGYTVLERLGEQLPNDQRLRYMNYGKGVLFWQTREEAARFVNQFQDVVSADAYWYTDANVCSPTEGGALLGAPSTLPDSECHRAANYGLTVDHVRSLVRPAGAKPVWAFVELGHPFSEDDWPTITPEQVRAAVWSSLIHGARGIVYFNHSFGGPCATQHVLREDCYADTRETVTRLNNQITRLAPVLNAPFVDDMTTADGSVDFMTKYADESVYVFAAATDQSGGEATFSVRCFDDTQVTVVDESRSLDMVDGRFTDDFVNGEAVHLYRLEGQPSCPLSAQQ